MIINILNRHLAVLIDMKLPCYQHFLSFTLDFNFRHMLCKETCYLSQVTWSSSWAVTRRCPGLDLVLPSV